MTLEELEQLKADGMVDDRKYQQLKSYIEMNGYNPNKNSMANYTPSNLGYNVGADSVPYQESKPSLYDRGGIQSMIASQEIDRGAKIRQLESQIAMVKERIERNKRALVGKSYEDVNKKLAQLEMKKIGMRLNHNNANTDPTSLWRWNQGRLDTKEANANVNKNSANKFANTVSMYANRRYPVDRMGTQQIQYEINNIEGAIRDGLNANADVSKLYEVREELYKALNGEPNKYQTNQANTNEYSGSVSERTSASFDDFYNQKHSSQEWYNYLKTTQGLTNEQINKGKEAMRAAVKSEKDKKKENAFKEWLKNRGKDKTTNQKILDSERKLFEAQYRG